MSALETWCCSCIQLESCCGEGLHVQSLTWIHSELGCSCDLESVLEFLDCFRDQLESRCAEGLHQQKVTCIHRYVGGGCGLEALLGKVTYPCGLEYGCALVSVLVTVICPHDLMGGFALGTVSCPCSGLEGGCLLGLVKERLTCLCDKLDELGNSCAVASAVRSLSRVCGELENSCAVETVSCICYKMENSYAVASAVGTWSGVCDMLESSCALGHGLQALSCL